MFSFSRVSLSRSLGLEVVFVTFWLALLFSSLLFSSLLFSLSLSLSLGLEVIFVTFCLFCGSCWVVLCFRLCLVVFVVFGCFLLRCLLSVVGCLLVLFVFSCFLV